MICTFLLAMSENQVWARQPQSQITMACLYCRWHIEGDINHDWKKLAQRKEKQLRKLSDTYKGQLDKVHTLMQQCLLCFIPYVSDGSHVQIITSQSCFAYGSHVASSVLGMSSEHRS